MLELTLAQALAAASIVLAAVLVGLALIARRTGGASGGAGGGAGATVGGGDAAERSGVGALRLGLSQAVSAYSFWILIGVSAAAYVDGLAAAWVFDGFVIGAAVNALYVGRRLRKAAIEQGLPVWLSATGTTVPVPPRPSESAQAHGAWQGSASAGAAGILLLVLFVAMVAQLRVAGHLLADALDVAVWAGVGLIGAVVAAVVFIGERRGAIDGAALIAVLLVPIAVLLLLPAIVFAGSLGNLFDMLAMSTQTGTGGSGRGVLSWLVALLVGLSLPGLPHVLDQFGAARDERTAARAGWVALLWLVLLTALMLLIGWCARALYTGLSPDLLLVDVAERLLPPYLQALAPLAVCLAVCAALSHQLLAAGEAAAPHWLAIGDPTQRPQRVRRVRAIVIVLAVLVAAVVNFGSSRVLLFALVALGAVVAPALLARLAGKNWRPATVALTVRAGLILTLLLFLAG